MFSLSKSYTSPTISISRDSGSTLLETIIKLSNILCNPAGVLTTNSNSNGSCLSYHLVGNILLFESGLL